jgi:hypothetical protein
VGEIILPDLVDRRSRIDSVSCHHGIGREVETAQIV